MHTLYNKSFLLYFLLTLSILALPIKYTPVVMGELTTFIPYSQIKINLDSTKVLKEGENKVLKANINLPEEVIKYEWREDSKLLSTQKTFSTQKLSVGTHLLNLTVIDSNDMSISREIKLIIVSKEYKGLRKKITINNENYIKLISASNYLEHLEWEDLPERGKGIILEDNSDSKTKLGSKIFTYNNYKYNESIINGSKRIDIVSIKKYSDSTKIKVKNDINITFKTLNSEINLKIKFDVDIIVDKKGNSSVNYQINKYLIYDKDKKEFIEVLDFNKNPKLYVSSLGYVNIDTESENFRLYGENNSHLVLKYQNEEAIFETQYTLDVDDGNDVEIPYQVEIYSPKVGHGSIHVMLNNIKKNDFYFVPYKVSRNEPLKFYAPNGKPKLLEYSFYSWNINYNLLNLNKNDTKINIEWYIDGKRVYLSSLYELPYEKYKNANNIKVVINAISGGIKTRQEEFLSADELNKRVSSGIYEYPEDTFDIVYKTNNKKFRLNLLSHEYFDDIDIENSNFSWTVLNVLDEGIESFSIDKATQYNKIPIVQYKESSYGYKGSIYLKIFSKYTMKVVRFNITLSHGDTGIVNNNLAVIKSIDEADLTNNAEYVATNKVYHYDIDKNGLDDIIYESETHDGSFLNVSYQNDKRIFEFDKISIDGRIYLGDFNGDGKKEVFVFGNENDSSKIISLKKGNLHTTKNINISNYMNILNIEKIADINNDGKDDLVISNNQDNKLYIYTNIDNLNEKYVLGTNKCKGPLLSVTDVNSDGLKDIVCSPKNRFKYLYTKNYDDYVSSYLDITYYLQKTLNSFKMKTNVYTLETNVKYQTVSSNIAYGAQILDNTKIVVSLQDKKEYMLYIYDLSSDSNKSISKVKTNMGIVYNFFNPKDINNDGLNDLLAYENYGSGRMNIFNQKKDFIFDSDYNLDLTSYNSLMDESLENAFLDDIDNDGSLEIVTVNGENKFSYINFK